MKREVVHQMSGDILYAWAATEIIEKIPPKGESFSDFIATFAMSVGFDTYFDLQH